MSWNNGHGSIDSQQQSVEQNLQNLSINSQRKKKNRHVLDASVSAPQSNGFAEGQWAGQTQQKSALTSQNVQQHQSFTQPVQSHAQFTTPDSQMDTSQIPNLSNEARESADYYRTNAFHTGQSGALNPPANVDFFAIDGGTANPKQARLSMGLMPATPELATSTQLPLSLILQPLADLRPEETVVSTIDCTSSGVPRCHRCRAYINPAMLFINGGGKFICNICGFPNETPAEYYSPCDMSGRRQDWEYRPELQFGTCDFVVGKDYWSREREPKPLHILFAIDVSEQALLRHVPQAAANAIRDTIYGSDQKLPEGAKISIMTFDRACHFYDLSPELKSTKMMCVSDIDDIFVPMKAGFFADSNESQHIIESVLETISHVFDAQSCPEPALGAVTKAAYMAMHDTGGKLCLFLGALPTWGPGKLKMRENTSLYNTPEERVLFDAQNIHWKNVAEEFVTIGVGVDCFFFPNSYIDIATIGMLSQTTGGDIFFYQNFIAERDALKFSKELQRCVHRAQGHSVQMKVRCSNGLKLETMIGSFLQRGPSDLEMGQLDADKAVTCVFKHDDKLDAKSDVHFQSAVLFTSPTGLRILRTQNIRCPVSGSIGDIVRSCDAGAAIATIAKQSALDVLKQDHKAVKHFINEQCIRTLAAYRKHCAMQAPPSELILPESLKLFPLLTLALQKQFAFRTDSINSDVRVHNQRLIRSSSTRDLLSLIYPRLIPIHSLQPADGFPDESGQLLLPSYAKNSFSNLEAGGAYILDNGQYILLWFKSDVSPNLLEDLYGPGVNTLEMLQPRSSELPHLDTLLNTQVRNIVNYLNSFNTSRHLSPQIARQGLDGSEMIFAASLVEDRNCDAMSYVDFLVHVHRHVQITLNEQKQQSSFTSRWISGET